jgi:hypothetical protein
MSKEVDPVAVMRFLNELYTKYDQGKPFPQLYMPQAIVNSV